IAVETTQSRLEAPWRWAGLVLEFVGAAAATTRAHELIGDQVHAGAGRLILLTNAWLLVSVAAFVGAARRRSRDRYNQAFERAAVLEAQQAAERRLAVIETQQRIARDVHDLLGHSLTVIAMQAEGARAILATDPAAADEALAVIGETSRRSVDEVRSLVDMLRSDVGGGASDDVDTGADPDDCTSSNSDTGSGATGNTVDAEIGALAESGVAASGHEDRLELLREPVRQAQRAGLPVTLETDPTDRIPAATAQVLHRVVQESLTNVLRHAPGADTRVLLRTEMGRVALVVENTPAPHPPGPQASDAHVGDGEDGPVHRGFGLIGMRDRVTDLGGSFAAGPTPEGGWRVRAELPASPE
uniref:sensor histidine kinase n=1 Tax=Actinomyces naeslundii TaxID=1655 RepID=UPI00241D7B35